MTRARCARVACVGTVAGSLLGAGVLMFSADPVGGDVVTPAGACTGQATFESTRVTDTSAEFVPSDVVKVPQSDTVKWEGNEKGYAVGSSGPRRAINGAVTLSLPVGTATIWHWGGTSTRYANEGSETYNLPSVVDNIKLQLSGFQQDAGKTTCSGSVYVEVTSSTFKSPLTYGSLAGIVIFGGLLLYAGRPVFKKNWAYDDIDR